MASSTAMTEELRRTVVDQTELSLIEEINKFRRLRSKWRSK
jgi:hypothetical protein